VKNKYSYISILVCCIFIVACGNSNHIKKEYVSQNLSADKIKISQEVFTKIQESHYVKDFVGKILIKIILLLL